MDLLGRQGSYRTCDSPMEGTMNGTLEDLEQGKLVANCGIYSSLLQQCCGRTSLFDGRRIHAHILKNSFGTERLLNNFLIQMYGKCEALDDALVLFQRIGRQNIFSFNNMILAYVQCGRVEDAKMVFDTMSIRNVFSWNIMLAAYVQDQNFEQANYLFSNMPEKDVVSWNAMLAMYGQCGRLEDAFAMFKVMPVRNVISWNSMITACVQYGDGEEALQLFSEMKRNGLKPNKVTFITILSACTTINALVQGRFVHAQILETGFLPDKVLGNALVNMYGKCGSLEDANALFDRMARPSVQWWNAIIAVYSQYRRSRDAVKLYMQMQREGVKQDKATFVTVLSACSTLTALAEGRLIHASIVESGQYLVLDVRNALVNMYSKCGSLEDAFVTFNKISHKDLISWNTIIAAFAQHGQVQETIDLFEQLESTHALPNDLSILAILSACSKVFLTDEGCHFFICLTQRHNITPTVNHYNCIVDLLGRAGWLNEAMDLLKSMPGQPIASSWLALLSASKMHADVKHADYAAKECFRLDPESSAPYAILSNIYATARLIEA